MDWIMKYYFDCLIGISLIAAFILGLRFFLGKKLSKGYLYGLWILIPVFMLLAPFVHIPAPAFFQEFHDSTKEQLEGEIRTIFIPAEERAEYEERMEIVSKEKYEARTESETEKVSPNAEVSDEGAERRTVEFDWKDVCNLIYLLMAGLFVAGVVSTNIKFEHKCRHNRIYLCETPNSKLPVYQLENISSPFLLCATVYVPEGMTEEEMRYAMLHEEGHFKHGDFFWVILRYLILVLFFYNPIIWFAFKFSGYDCELACDESVMRMIKKEEYTRYGSCLLDVIKKHKKVSERVLLSTNMKSEKKLIRARIENIVSAKKKNIVLMFAVAGILILVSGCALMDKTPEKGKNSSEEILEVIVEEDAETEQGSTTETVGKEPSAESATEQFEQGNGIIEYGDKVYCSVEHSEIIERDENSMHSRILEDACEIAFTIEEDALILNRSYAFLDPVISYAAKECIGKKVGDTIRVIREVDGKEYFYDFIISSENGVGDPAFEVSEKWEYQFAPAVIGEFFQTSDEEIDFACNEEEIEVGGFCVSGERKNYAKATASSELASVGEYTYHAWNLTSQVRSSVWSEGVPGYGIGEYIDYAQMYLGPGPERLVFEKLCIVNGYAETEEKWKANSRVKSMKVYYCNTYVGTITLEDTLKPQFVDLTPLQLSIGNGREAVFRFEIEEVYEGEKFDDTCLTGIELSYVMDEFPANDN